MDHDSHTRAKIIRDYLSGRLSDTERDAFEAHYFGCDECAKAVMDAGSVKRRLFRLVAIGIGLAALIAIGLLLRK